MVEGIEEEDEGVEINQIKNQIYMSYNNGLDVFV